MNDLLDIRVNRKKRMKGQQTPFNYMDSIRHQERQRERATELWLTSLLYYEEGGLRPLSMVP